jgi:ribonuclease HI
MQSSIVSFFTPTRKKNSSTDLAASRIDVCSNASATKSVKQCDEYVLFFDGCSKHNPGPSGAGAVLYHNGVEIWSKAVFVGNKETNNVAEYTGMIIGLTRAVELGLRKLVVKGDSNLVIQQMNGKFRVNAPNMKPLFATARNLVRHFESIQFIHVYRHLNTRADELSNLGLIT